MPKYFGKGIILFLTSIYATKPAQCTKDEKLLLENRRKNLCVYVGKSNKSGKNGSVVKHYHCCWNNMLNKTIQVEGRKQLGISFGSGSLPDCRGLTLSELIRLDFNKMDLSEAYADIVKKMKLPNISDIDSRTKDNLNTIRTDDGTGERNKDNKKAGVNTKVEGTLSNEASY